MDDAVVLLGVAGPVDDGPQARGVALELLEIIRQMGDGMLLNGCGALPQFFPFGQTVGALVALRADEPQRLVMPVGVGVVVLT